MVYANETVSLAPYAAHFLPQSWSRMAHPSNGAAHRDWNAHQKSCAAEYKAQQAGQAPRTQPKPAAPKHPAKKAGPSTTKSDAKKLVQKQLKTETKRQRLTGKQSSTALNRGSASSDAFRRERDAANTEATRKRLQGITRHSNAESAKTKAFKSVSDQLRDGRAGKPPGPGSRKPIVGKQASPAPKAGRAARRRN
jgi:hypothetical protein